MYGQYLTAKVEAKKHGELKAVMLTAGVADMLSRPRLVSSSTTESDPVYYGFAGDFEVYPGAGENTVVTESGTRIEF